MHSSYRGSQEWRRIGLLLTTGSEEACKLYDAAITQILGWSSDENLGGLEGTLSKMMQADPDFVMGHVLKNWLTLASNTKVVHGNNGLVEDLAQMVNLVKTTPAITKRETQHVHALDLWSQGYWDRATCLWEDILLENPHDISAISMIFNTYLFGGKLSEIRDCIARVLPYWKPTMPHYGYLLGLHAYGLEESNMYPQAEKSVREALLINPKDAWSTHTLCHIMERTGRQGEISQMMEDTQSNWEFGRNLACHNYWHWALSHIEMGDYESAISIFDNQLKSRLSGSGSLFNLSDVSSLLYRLQFEGAPIGDRWYSISDVYQDHIDDHVWLFNDMHIFMACLNSKEEGLAEKMMASIEEYIREGQGENRDATAAVGVTVMKAFSDYQNGDFSAAVDKMYPIKYKIAQIGGSNAQRDVFNQFLIQAAIKSPREKHHKLARSLVNERKSLLPNSPMTDRLMAKVMELH